ncbi:hypothetical protein PoB_003358700 [Plakobranchus ocellatus]|uniref:Uncharacterized protein n=1 Tax=Plakobranchus ocellatus TaxID=259542 RepID=A0AAV4AJB2_9GAST|nr:hypothetical protein PoB_003358700 [Plakobranchus ocellatus]
MSRHRTGPIFTQEILNNLVQTMEGKQLPTGQSDEAVFQEKMQALQRFLHHGMSRFSTESLQRVLDSIVPSQPPGTPGEHANDRPLPKMEVKSIKALRDVVKMVMTKRELGSIKASDADALKYIEHFFYAVFCMTEAKRLIDVIYADLYFSYYKPEGESRQATVLSSDVGADSVGEHTEGHYTEDYSMFGISTLEQLTGSTHHKLRLTVRDMQDVLARWADLLTQGEPDSTSFEPESEQDLLLVRTSSRTQPILRLLPDTFAKFYKCLELCKQWWVLAHEVYPHLPFQRRPPEEAEVSLELSSVGSHDWAEEKATLTDQVVLDTKEAIREINSEIEAVQEELEALSRREEKFAILTETYDKVGQDIEARTRERQQMLTHRDRLAQSGNQNAQLREDLAATEAGIRQLDGMLKLLDFQHSLLLQDYLIHLEIRPSIIRFQGEATLRLKEAQIQLEKQALNLEKLEQEMSAELQPTEDEANSDISGDSVGSGSRFSKLSDTEDDRESKSLKKEKKNQPSSLKQNYKQQNDLSLTGKNDQLSTKDSYKRKVAFEQSDKIISMYPLKNVQQNTPKIDGKLRATATNDKLEAANPLSRPNAKSQPANHAKKRIGNLQLANYATMRNEKPRPTNQTTAESEKPQIANKISTASEKLQPVNQPTTASEKLRPTNHTIKTTEKQRAVVNQSTTAQKPVDEGKPHTTSGALSKRNSVPAFTGLHRHEQKAQRRKSQDDVVHVVEKPETKISRSIRKDSTGHPSPQKNFGSSEKPALDKTNKLAADKKRSNPLVKSLSSKEVLSRQEKILEDSESPRIRSISDPHAVPKDALAGLKRKSSMPKAGADTSSKGLPSAELEHAQKNKVTRPKPVQTLKKQI